MKMQKDMESAMLLAHRSFLTELEKAIKIAERELNEATEMQGICTDEWCMSTELYLDDLHKSVYAISEPRFASEEDSMMLKNLRSRIKDLYVRFQKQTR